MKQHQKVKYIAGQSGVEKVKYIGGNGHGNVVGEVTKKVYPFSLRPVLYVDTRDAIYLLGEEYVIA